MCRKSLRACLLAMALLLPSTLSQAAFITNGGFETGDFTGWSCFAPYCDVIPSGVGAAPPAHSGDYLFGGGSYRDNGVLSQLLNTVAGQEYELTFYSIFEFLDGENFFRYQVGDVSGAPRITDYWQPTTANFVASSANTTLRFLFSTDTPGWGPVGLDDVSIRRVGAVVPLPSSWVLFSLGLLLLGFCRRSRY